MFLIFQTFNTSHTQLKFWGTYVLVYHLCNHFLLRQSLELLLLNKPLHSESQTFQSRSVLFVHCAQYFLALFIWCEKSTKKHFFKNKFIYLFLAALGLRCCVQAFSSCGNRGLPFVAVCRLLFAVASLAVEHGL